MPLPATQLSCEPVTVRYHESERECHPAGGGGAGRWLKVARPVGG